MATDLAPFAGTVGGGFFIGFITGYAIKKVIKLAAVIVGLFIAALAYLEFQRILTVDWNKVQGVSQNGISCANIVVVRPAVPIPNINNVAPTILKIATMLIFLCNVELRNHLVVYNFRISDCKDCGKRTNTALWLRCHLVMELRRCSYKGP